MKRVKFMQVKHTLFSTSNEREVNKNGTADLQSFRNTGGYF